MEKQSEFEYARQVADKVLDTPYKDPDDTESMLARQFLRQVERNKQFEQKLVELEKRVRYNSTDKGEDGIWVRTEYVSNFIKELYETI